MQEFTVDTRVLRALLHLSGVKDMRRYLNGVHVVFTPDQTVYTATNGTVLGRVTERAANPGSAVLIIPREVIKALRPTVKDLATAALHIDEGRKARIVQHLPAGTVDINFTPIDGQYPDCDRVIPARTSGEAGNYDAELLALFTASNKELGAKYPGQFKLHQNGADGAALVSSLVRSTFVGVIMPMRV